jgi:hypothetical protein
MQMNAESPEMTQNQKAHACVVGHLPRANAGRAGNFHHDERAARLQPIGS